MGFRRSGIPGRYLQNYVCTMHLRSGSEQRGSIFIKFSKRFLAWRRWKTLLLRLPLEGLCLPFHLSLEYLVKWYFKSLSNTACKSGSIIIRPLSFYSNMDPENIHSNRECQLCQALMVNQLRYNKNCFQAKFALLTMPGSPGILPLRCFLPLILLLLTDYWFPTIPWL